MSSNDEGMLIDLTQEIVSMPTARTRRLGVSALRGSALQAGLGLWRFRFTILSAAIVGIGCGLGYLFVNPRAYESTALVSLGDHGYGREAENRPDRIGDHVYGLSNDIKVVLVKSFSLAATILEKNPDFTALLGRSDIRLLDRHHPDAPTQGRTTSSPAEISSYLNHISYRYSEGAHLLAISAVAPDPVAAARVANIHSQGLIDLVYEKQASQTEAVLADIRHREEDARNSYYASREREISLEEELRKGSHDPAEQSKLHSDLEMVKKSSEFAKEFWDASKRKLLYATQVTSDLKGMTIIDPAVPPLSPTAPGLLFVLCIGGLGGALTGVILALIRESRDSSLHSVLDCMSQLGRPVIGTIPALSAETKRATTLMASRSSSSSGSRTPESSTSITSWFRYHVSSEKARAPFLLAAPFSSESEAVRAMAASLAHNSLYNRQNIILFTSPAAREGKSLLATNTAIALAQMHKRTLLIDADLRSPSIHRYFGFHREAVGLFDFSLSAMEMNDLILESSTEGLMLLLSGSPAPLPTLITHYDRIESGIRSLSPLFDAIIIDAPAIGSVVDPLLLSRMAHSVVLVGRFNQTTLREIQIALEQLDQANAHVVGVALNDIKDDPLIRYLNN